MNIQSLSVCVPAGCPNNCAYCVSAMNKQPDNTYENLAENALCRRNNLTAEQEEEYDLLWQQYANRMAFARDNGCNTMMITSSGEALMNMGFIAALCQMNRDLRQPFRWIELQTSGIKLSDEILELLRRYGISTICLSLADIFDDHSNARINGIQLRYQFVLEDLCRRIKQHGFNLRLSLNMSDVYNGVAPEQIFARAAELGANQITFRKLYVSDIYKGTPQAKWIEEHPYGYRKHHPKEDGAPIGDLLHFSTEWHEAYGGRRPLDKNYGTIFINHFQELNRYIVDNGIPLELLPFGAMRYSVHGLSTVVDLNCMNKGVKDDGSVKYLILRPDCHLYTRWDDPASLLF